MRRLVRALLLLLLGGVVVAAAGWFAVQRALRHEPDFYRRAMTQPPEAQEEAGIELEKEVLDLHNQVRREGRWQASFAENELNGWLAADLPRKFRKLLPKEAADPRLALRDGEAAIACRYQTKDLESVISIQLRLGLTDSPNEVAIRVLKVRAGALPLPLSKVLDQVSNAARREGIRLRWTEEGGDPVALIHLAPRHPEFPDRQIIVDQLEIEGGQLVLGGVVQAEQEGDTSAAELAGAMALVFSLEAATTLILR